ncbi:hypothetical protein GCM10009809_19060 [Isoptericola hypogeus]|uniref:Uncharacterized protein n=1 Tax=Isoptericola hypogeus TaxID=300179 RepID=A0ABN2JDI7_9MICO
MPTLLNARETAPRESCAESGLPEGAARAEGGPIPTAAVIITAMPSRSRVLKAMGSPLSRGVVGETA